MGFNEHELRDLLGRWTGGGSGSSVSVTEHHSGRLHVTSPYDKPFIASIKSIGGTWSPKSKTWSVPGERAPELSKLLDRTYGHGGATSSLASMPSGVSITHGSGQIEVKAPYNNDFRAAAKSLGGRWNGTDKSWVFPAHRQSDVARLAEKHYGTTAGAPNLPDTVKPHASQSGRASDKQISYALLLIDRYERSGGHWGDIVDWASRPPTRAELVGWDARDVSMLISDLREGF